MSEFATFLIGQLLQGLKLTIVLLVVCGTLGHLLAIPVALARTSERWWLKAPAFSFILVLRGTPVLVQLYIAYYGMGEVLSGLPGLRYSMWWPLLRQALGYAVLALSLNTAAYCGEIWRGAIQSIPIGQMEAGRSLGLSQARIMRFVVLPQAFRLALPALGNQTVLLLKATSLASTITVFEVTDAANLVRAQTFQVYEPLFAAALVYVALTLILTGLFGLAERRLGA